MTASVGTAYLTLVPKMESGWKSSVSNEVLPASEKLGEDAGKKSGDGFSLSFGSAVKTLAKSAAVVKGAKLVGSTFADAIGKYSDYEQLAGGVEKIFGDTDTSRIFADAQEAYKNLNMSANEYLAVINDVGASFSATMGDEAGYETAREGLQAIADYASGTGKSVDVLSDKFTMITRSTASYQSIADQFSGVLPATSAGFLEQAQAAGFLSDTYKTLTEVPIDEYQAAVSKMLAQGVQDLGLYENTANESFNTVSGSVNMTKAAWDNLLVALGDPNGDIDAAMDNLITSVGALAENIFPVAVQIGSAIIQGVIKGVAGIGSEIEKAVMGGLNGLMGGDQSTMDSAWSDYQGFLSSGNYGVPMYASGGYFEAGKPRRGVLGDGSYDEAALPLSPGVFARMGEGIREAMGSAPGGGDTIIINGITVDGDSSAARAVRAMVDAVGVRSRS